MRFGCGLLPQNGRNPWELAIDQALPTDLEDQALRAGPGQRPGG